MVLLALFAIITMLQFSLPGQFRHMGRLAGLLY